MPRDPSPPAADLLVGADSATETPDDAACLCVECRAEITRPQWAVAVGGAHERAFFNPSGRVFRVLCFGAAPGVADVTPPSDDFTWFPGYAWSIVVCRNCGVHLGWRYQGATAPQIFFGLIKPMLAVADGGRSR